MDTNNNNGIAKSIILGILALAVLFAAYAVSKAYQKKKVANDMEQVAPLTTIDATYRCDANKTIEASFGDRIVVLKLSDGRNVTLPQTISASGVRFANEDETFVFWNKGNTAFIEETGTTTYVNCIETDRSENPPLTETPPAGGFETMPPPAEGVFCTMDAKLCPDGSYVGRIPPNCEFAQCPVLGK